MAWQTANKLICRHAQLAREAALSRVSEGKASKQTTNEKVRKNE